MLPLELELDPARSLQSEFGRLYEGHVGHAIYLLETQPDGLDEAVHKARRSLKKARALCLLCACAAPSFMKSTRKELGQAARSISSLRDTAAMVECATWLQDFLQSHNSKDLADDLLSRLKERHRTRTIDYDRITADISKVIAVCKNTIEMEHKLQFSTLKDREILAEGWAKRQRDARNALKSCTKGKNPESFHDLRKSTQQTVFQSVFLTKASPTFFNAFRKEAKTLASTLGNEHDLDVMRALLKKEPAALCVEGREKELSTLLKARQKELRGEALKLAKPLYSEKSKAAEKRIKSVWKKAA